MKGSETGSLVLTGAPNTTHNPCKTRILLCQSQAHHESMNSNCCFIHLVWQWWWCPIWIAPPPAGCVPLWWGHFRPIQMWHLSLPLWELSELSLSGSVLSGHQNGCASECVWYGQPSCRRTRQQADVWRMLVLPDQTRPDQMWYLRMLLFFACCGVAGLRPFSGPHVHRLEMAWMQHQLNTKMI